MNNDLIKRAIVAYYKSSRELTELPSASFAEARKKRYILLRLRDELVAVYRIANSGQLNRLKRYPAELSKL